MKIYGKFSNETSKKNSAEVFRNCFLKTRFFPRIRVKIPKRILRRNSGGIPAGTLEGQATENII